MAVTAWIAASSGAFAVTVGFVLLAGGPGPDGADLWAPAPFAWLNVLVVHSLAALPLAWLAAGWIQSQSAGVDRGRQTSLAALGLLLAALVAAMAIHRTSTIDEALAGASPVGESLIRFVARLLLCVTIAIPIWLAAGAWLSDLRLGVARPPRWLVAWLLVGSISMTWTYEAHVVGEQWLETERLSSQAEITAARQQVERLLMLGAVVQERAPSPLGGVDSPSRTSRWSDSNVELRQLRTQLLAAEQLLAARVAELRASAATPWEVAELGQLLASLGRPAEAELALLRSAQTHPAPAAALAQLHQQQRHWVEASRWWLQVIELCREPASETAAEPDWAPLQHQLLTESYERLAHHARELGAPAEAVRWYQQAIRALPEDEPAWRARLARHYQVVGRPADARREALAAHRLDPDAHPKPAGILQGVLTSGTPVGLFRDDASSSETSAKR